MITPEPEVVSAIRFYRVRPSSPIRVRVIVGNGQAGGTVLHWRGGSKTFPGEDRSAHVVGQGMDLTNTFLDVTTTVRDIREETNRTSVTIQLEGGVDPAEFTFEREVKEWGVVIYAIEFSLIS